jgi:1,4-alpha-glucan branching enzyme
MSIRVNIIWCFLLFAALAGKAQPIECTVKDDAVFFSLNLSAKKPVLDSLCKSLETGKGFADSLHNGLVKTGMKTAKYTVYTLDKKYITLRAPMITYAQSNPGVFDIIIIEELFSNTSQYGALSSNKQYGVNDFATHHNRTSQGTTRFFLPGFEDAREVYLGSSHNHWNYTQTPMHKTAGGWELDLGLKPGKHLYKFVVDGTWMLDPTNKQKEKDGMGNENNVLFVYNHRFYLPGHADAKNVFVAASFNEWKERDLRLKRSGNGWALELFVPEGTHAYKFIADGQWMLDPSNPIVRGDQQGIPNSYLGIGDTVYFELKAFPQAREVFVSGDFNGWQERELRMKKTSYGWRLGYVLGAGNYHYKFIVDGQWITDPKNPHKAQHAGELNSLLCIKPNHRFTYPHAAGLQSVQLSGTFNNWDPFGYSMALKGNMWFIDVHLEEGKQLYKFVADGNWKMDPSNPLYEQNEFGTGNSVLWVTEE